jgi:hypothetical protein
MDEKNPDIIPQNSGMLKAAVIWRNIK